KDESANARVVLNETQRKKASSNVPNSVQCRSSVLMKVGFFDLPNVGVVIFASDPLSKRGHWWQPAKRKVLRSPANRRASLHFTGDAPKKCSH
ncbi:MAG: hypothetical protein ABIS36_13435, partial [Chryseolinea sp.]